MKKKLLVPVFFILAIILYALIFVNFPSQNNTFQQSNTHSPKSINDQTQKQSLPEKKENLCQESENIIHSLLKKFPKKRGKHEAEMLLQDESIKKIVIENNECGANAASWLANVYLKAGLKDKANEYHKMVVDFAEKNNTTAIVDLCGYDYVTSTKQKLHYCKIVMNKKNIAFKSEALFFLGKYYFGLNQDNKIIELCQHADKDKDLCLDVFLFRLGDKFLKEKKYKQAIEFYKKVEPLDESGFIAYSLAGIYAGGEYTKPDYPTAISWYEKALGKNNSDEARSNIINDMGVAYAAQNEYILSFKCYKEAAIMGNALGQWNLARQYAGGYGTIEDYKKAYAWVTVSMVQGLEKDLRSKAKNLKDALTYELIKQDKNGMALAEAKKLAQKYYNHYMSHKEQLLKKIKILQKK